MDKNYPLSQIQELLTQAQNVLVLMPTKPSFDHVASTLSLYLALEKAGKKATVVSPDKMVVGFSHLVGLDRVKSEFGENDLVITVGAPIDNIEKVFTTNEKMGNLQIVIRSKSDMEPVRQENLSFSSQGALPDLIFTIGVRKPEGLGEIYQTKKEMFFKTPVVNIDNHPQNASFGRINIVDTRASSLSEIMAFLISGLNLPADQDIGANLILGLRRATDNFQRRQVTAATFEAASMAMRFQGESALPREVMPTTEEPPVPQESSEQPPPEWLEPKIYKGSTLP